MSNFCECCGSPLNKDLHLVVILDESGSMGVIKESTISGINEFIQSQNIPDAKTWLTLTKFDTGFRSIYKGIDISEFVPLNKDTYHPDGCTALYDAIGDTLNSVYRKGNEKIMVVIMTDGQENSSRLYTFQSIKSMIEDKRGAGWEFTFLGANMDAYAVGTSMGINTSATWTANAVGTRSATKATSFYTTAYRTDGTVMASADLQKLVDDEQIGN